MNTESKSYLIVFHGTFEGNKIVDIGNDPSFDQIPTWGICRPKTRKAIQIGHTLFFLAKIKDKYFLKGWFEVGEKIDYISALERFPSNKNVIISKISCQRKNHWRYGHLKKEYQKVHGTQIPHFLLNIISKGKTYYQNPIDEHEIDNWKCRRIFNCNSNQFKKCIANNVCLKNANPISDFENYIVANPNKWDTLDDLKITIEDIRTAINFTKAISTPYNQHNVLKFDDYKTPLIEYINRRKKFSTSIKIR